MSVPISYPRIRKKIILALVPCFLFILGLLRRLFS